MPHSTCMSRQNHVNKLSCPNENCSKHRRIGLGNIIRHSFYKGSEGRRRRYRCKGCGKTFSSTYGTAYYRLQSSRTVFDEVVTMSSGGVDKSAISRIKGMSWNTAEALVAASVPLRPSFQRFCSKGIQG